MAKRLFSSIALAAALAALAGCGGGNDTRPAQATEPTKTEHPATTTSTAPASTPTAPARQPETITIRVVGGKPEGGIARPKVDKDDKVVLTVRSDIADEVHLHGYDISRKVTAGGTARIAFVAKIPGRFEVELEDSGVQIAELTVQ